MTSESLQNREVTDKNIEIILMTVFVCLFLKQSLYIALALVELCRLDWLQIHRNSLAVVSRVLGLVIVLRSQQE